jgi:hypothetical protein
LDPDEELLDEESPDDGVDSLAGDEVVELELSLVELSLLFDDEPEPERLSVL